jgi:hypothetical protein
MFKGREFDRSVILESMRKREATILLLTLAVLDAAIESVRHTHRDGTSTAAPQNLMCPRDYQMSIAATPKVRECCATMLEHSCTGV